jgi:hypothetical protein
MLRSSRPWWQMGANEGSMLVNVEPLTANELTKLVTLVESMVGDKYKSRAEWGSMSDANRFLSGVMAAPKTYVFLQISEQIKDHRIS